MHPAAFQWAKEHVPEQPRRVLEIGGADINCSLRNFYTWSEYICVDSHAGPGVDVVADAERWMATFTVRKPADLFDLIVSFEVFEHTKEWPASRLGAHHLLSPGGLLIGTCAAPGRATHSAWGTPELKPGEFYENVPAASLALGLEGAGFTEYTIDRARSGLDLRWKARRT
jgi:hypothetical protein